MEFRALRQTGDASTSPASTCNFVMTAPRPDMKHHNMHGEAPQAGATLCGRGTQEQMRCAGHNVSSREGGCGTDNRHYAVDTAPDHRKSSAVSPAPATPYIAGSSCASSAQFITTEIRRPASASSLPGSGAGSGIADFPRRLARACKLVADAGAVATPREHCLKDFARAWSSCRS